MAYPATVAPVRASDLKISASGSSIGRSRVTILWIGVKSGAGRKGLRETSRMKTVKEANNY
nr:hypothetical protein Itr_chr01CG08750 [Ipomoea trifida]